MPAAAPAGAPAPATDLAALSTALICAHAWARAHPGRMSEVYAAGYQRSIQWVHRQNAEGAWEHLIVLRREHLAPYDLDHENVALALQGARDGKGGELVVLDWRWMKENDHGAGCCYRVGTPPTPEPEAEAA